MFTQKWANVVFAIMLLGVVGYMSWLAWGFETNPFADAFLPVKFFPLLLLGCVELCIILYVFEYLTQGYSGDDKDGMVFDDFGGLVRTLLTIVFTIAAYFIWRMKGFDVALPWQDTTMRVPAYSVAGVFLPLFIAFAMGARHWTQFIIIFVSTLLVFVAFTYGLNIQFR